MLPRLVFACAAMFQVMCVNAYMISSKRFTCLYWKLNKDNVCVTVAKVAAAAAAAARASRSLPGWLHRPGVDSEEARRLQRKIHSRVTIYQYFHDLRISYESPESVTVSRADWAASVQNLER